MIEVVNIRTFSMKDRQGEFCYVGRRMAGRPGSPLGNPYKLSEGERDEVLARYKTWLWEQMKTETGARRELYRLAEINRQQVNLYLACWCAPESCHGDIIKAAIQYLNSQHLNKP